MPATLSISIPFSTIKSLGFVDNAAHNYISIPFSTIKSDLPVTDGSFPCVFQFHLVRLKVRGI